MHPHRQPIPHLHRARPAHATLVTHLPPHTHTHHPPRVPLPTPRQVTSATVKFLLLASTGASSISFIAHGSLNVTYGLVYGLLSLLTTPVGQWATDAWVRRTGAPSFLVILNLFRCNYRGVRVVAPCKGWRDLGTLWSTVPRRCY